MAGVRPQMKLPVYRLIPSHHHSMDAPAAMQFLHCHTNVTLHYGFQYKKSHVAEIITGPIIYSETWVRHFALTTGAKCTWQCDGNTRSLQNDYIKVIGHLLLRACWLNGNGWFNLF